MKSDKEAEDSFSDRIPEYLMMVLLIDDQPIVGQAVRNLLADEADIDFHYCADPQQAVALATELRPTVILQDLVMPGMDGLQMVRLMRNNPVTADTPIIVLSSKEDPITKRNAFAAGANDYLVKLPDKLELVARTRYHSKAHLNRIQRDEAYRALRESQQNLLESNSRLNATNQELESATRVKSEFLASMSHEIRTPLSGVIGMTTLLSDTALTKEQEGFVETIRSSGSALLELINDILDFSKMEAGKMEIENLPFDIISCVEETFDLLAVKAGEKKLSLGYVVESSVPQMLIGDVARIRQVLLNLVGNALKFTPQGEVSLRIFPAEGGTGNIQFSVRDTGIGIPRDRHDRLFKSFSQVDRSISSTFGGTGLGLAISKTLCEIMGGRIWADRQSGGGSTFHFTLSLGTQEGLASEMRSFPKQQVGKQVLLIEDKSMHQETLLSRMRQMGLSPLAAGNAEAGLRLTRTGPAPDAIVLSSRLDGMDATDMLKLVKTIRSESSAKNTPLILMVPQHAKHLYAQTRESGVSSFLYEPVREAQLKDVLGTACNVQFGSVSPVKKTAATDYTVASRFPLRILLAEDNSVNQLIALSFLRKLGYQADFVTNGLEAIASLERQPYDLIFMDVQMPEMDGMEASRKIRNQWNTGTAPRIIAMTANAMQGDREKCIQSGMDDYLTKPISLQSVAAALEKWGKQIHDAAGIPIQRVEA